jgi:hypothetical protein
MPHPGLARSPSAVGAAHPHERSVILMLITIPCAVRAVVWFGFYRQYPKDVQRMEERLAAQT